MNSQIEMNELSLADLDAVAGGWHFTIGTISGSISAWGYTASVTINSNGAHVDVTKDR
jgi:hypothetical protein